MKQIIIIKVNVIQYKSLVQNINNKSSTYVITVDFFFLNGTLDD